jgi:hypothetical protein
MRSMSSRTIGVAVALGCFASFTAVPAAQDAGGSPPTIIDLGTLGHDVSVAVAVNNKLQVIGWIADNFRPFRAPFLWEHGVMRELTAGPDLFLLNAFGINDRGQIAGSGTDVATSRSVALIWEDGVPIRLPTPPGYEHCGAHAVNNHGEVAGACAIPDGTDLRLHAVLWRDGEVVELAPGAAETSAIAINDRGIVLGAFRGPDGLGAGSFLWNDGVLTRLDPALAAGDLNDRGQLAAWRRLSGAAGYEALIVDRGTIIPLPAPPNAVNCLGFVINSHADVGGECGGFAIVWVDG